MPLLNLQSPGFGGLARDHPPKYQMTGVKVSERFTRYILHHLVLNVIVRMTKKYIN